MKDINAIHHSEERYASLTLIAYSQEQREKIQSVINREVPTLENITISESEVDDILETTIEYHDDYDKEAGSVFDSVMKCLEISECN